MSSRQVSPEEIADFRYRLVAEMANPYLSADERRQMIREKARVGTKYRGSAADG